MSKSFFFIFVFISTVLLTGCHNFSNTSYYEDATKAFVDALIEEDYKKCVDQMALDHEMARNTNLDSMIIGLAILRKHIVANWGTDLEYSFARAEKTSSTIEVLNTPPNTTLATVEFKNKEEFGVFRVLFDDKSKKLLNIKTLDIKAPIPYMINFWIFGLLAICIPIFNIFVIRLIKKSDLKKKWRKYIAVIFLNVPAIVYMAANGLTIKPFSFQFLLGVSFSYMGYLNSYWAFGIPLGGLYWFWKIKQRTNNSIISDNSEDSIIEPNPTNE